MASDTWNELNLLHYRLTFRIILRDLWFNIGAVASDCWVQNNEVACSVANSGMRDWGLGVPGVRAAHTTRLATHEWGTANSLGFGISVGVYCVQYSGKCLSYLDASRRIIRFLRTGASSSGGWHFRLAWRRCGRIQPQIFL
jgi:hypothetical protein